MRPTLMNKKVKIYFCKKSFIVILGDCGSSEFYLFVCLCVCVPLLRLIFGLLWVGFFMTYGGNVGTFVRLIVLRFITIGLVMTSLWHQSILFFYSFAKGQLSGEMGNDDYVVPKWYKTGKNSECWTSNASVGASWI